MNVIAKYEIVSLVLKLFVGKNNNRSGQKVQNEQNIMSKFW